MICKKEAGRKVNRVSLCCALIMLFFCSVELPHAIADDQLKQQKVEKMYRWYKMWLFRSAQEITVAEFIEISKTEQVLLVDSRTEKEREVSIIPWAVTKEEFEEKKESLRSVKIVVYCTIGSRSGRYSQKLLNEGFDVYNLVGGILSWAHSGQTFTDHDGRKTKTAHVYGRKWDLLPKGYQSVY